MKYFLIVFAAAMAVRAQDGALDQALDESAATKPDDAVSYLRARNRVLALGPRVIPLLRDRGLLDRWTEEGWVRALVAEVCRLRLENPTLAATVDRPRGLDPAVYQSYRRPIPLCAPELVHYGKDAVPLLLERWRWMFSEHPYSKEASGELEKEVFRQAILFVPGQLEDRRARHFLKDVLENDRNPHLWRQEAAVSLALCSGTEALGPLEKILENSSGFPPVREACARALGRIPSVQSLDSIRKYLKDPYKDAEIHRSLLTALGLLGNAWGWEARGLAVRELSVTIRKGCAEMLLEALRQRPAETDAIARALALTAWEDSKKQLAAWSGDPQATQELREAAKRTLRRLQDSSSR